MLNSDIGSSQRQRQCSCGRGAQNRIIGGQYAGKQEFPWAVRIVGGGCVGSCTGALISNRHILTAFHCLVPQGSRKPCDHSDGKRKAILGTNDVRSRSRVVVPLKRYAFPPNAGYRRWDRQSHDLAIYILDKPVIFSSNIQPICLPNPRTRYEGKPAVVAGWGGFRKGSRRQSRKLQKVSQTVHGVVRGRNPFITTERESHSNGTPMDPCGGDSGGPLMWMDKNGRYRIIGTVYGGGYNCEKNKYGSVFGDNYRQVYNNVQNYLGWIKSVLKFSRGTDQCAIIN